MLEGARVILGCGEVAGVYPLGASASMVSHASYGIHPFGGRSLLFSGVTLSGRSTRPSRDFPLRAHFRSSHSFVWVQRRHHGSGSG